MFNKKIDDDLVQRRYEEKLNFAFCFAPGPGRGTYWVKKYMTDRDGNNYVKTVPEKLDMDKIVGQEILYDENGVAHLPDFHKKVSMTEKLSNLKYMSEIEFRTTGESLRYDAERSAAERAADAHSREVDFSNPDYQLDAYQQYFQDFLSACKCLLDDYGVDLNLESKTVENYNMNEYSFLAQCKKYNGITNKLKRLSADDIIQNRSEWVRHGTKAPSKIISQFAVGLDKALKAQNIAYESIQNEEQNTNEQAIAISR